MTRDPGKAVKVFDLLLQFFGSGQHWHKGEFRDGNGSRCLVDTLQHCPPPAPHYGRRRGLLSAPHHAAPGRACRIQRRMRPLHRIAGAYRSRPPHGRGRQGIEAMTFCENWQQYRDDLLAAGIEPEVVMVELLSAFDHGLMTEAELREALEGLAPEPGDLL